VLHTTADQQVQLRAYLQALHLATAFSNKASYSSLAFSAAQGRCKHAMTWQHTLRASCLSPERALPATLSGGGQCACQGDEIEGAGTCAPATGLFIELAVSAA